jgi:TonB-linked SusC/RagA family outer membrane protein
MKSLKILQSTAIAGILVFFISAVQPTTANDSKQTSTKYLTVSTSEMEVKVDKAVDTGTKLADFLNSLEKEFDVNFFYKSEILIDKRFSKRLIISKGESLYDILSQLFPDFGLDYNVLTHRTIGISKRDDKQESDGRSIIELVTGQVTDEETGNTIPGVNVIVKGTTIGTSTDADGNYELEAPSLQDTLIFSFIGYERTEVPINGQTTLNISLAEQAIQGQEILVSGYQTQQRASVTGSISSVDTELAFAGKAVNNPIQSLQGQVAGLFVNTSGNPSGEDTEIRIRGVSTLNDNSPLYVIDGVPTKESAFNALNPNDIDDIQVLKDAPSAAIYGSRASNGVILITTKKSRENTFTVNYSSELSISRITNRPDLLNPTQRAQVHFWANTYVGNNPDDIPVVDYDWERTGPGRFDYQLNNVILPDMLADGVRANKEGTDWFDEVTRTGAVQEHNISISTGGDRGGALFSARVHDNQYIYKERRFSKYQVRVNSQFDVFEDGSFTIGENLSLSTSRDNGYKDNLQDALSGRSLRPILPVYDEDGDFSGPPTGDFTDSENPLGLLNINSDDLTQKTTLFGNVYANIDLLDNLSWNSNFGLDWSSDRLRDIDRRYQWGFLSNRINSLDNRDTNNFNWNLNSTLNYKLDFENHSTNFLAGTEATQNSETWNLSRREDFSIETLDFFVEGAGSGSQIVDGFKTGFSLLSFFGKVDYAYKRKYLASATVRYDGSSKFAEGNRFGTFPSATIGWRVTQESFMDNVEFLSEFKLRAGWGRTGNQQIANSARFDLFDVSYDGLPSITPWDHSFSYANYGTAYSYSGADTGTLPSGFRRTQTANPNLRWEETSEYNIGVDFSINNDKIYGSIDYFNRNTSDILIQPEIISAIGEGGSRFLNGASVEVQGFEVSTTYRNQVGDFNYRIIGNLGFFDDEITELPSDVVDSYAGNSEKTILGRSPNALFGYVADGLFRTQTEVDEHANQPGKDLGRIRYKDLNGDGVINTQDQDFFGSSTANIEYGVNLVLNYHGFDFSTFWQGIARRDVLELNRDNFEFPSSGSGTNYGTRILEAWTPTNSDSDIPALTLNDDNNEFRTSTYFLSNGAYTKLRAITIGYTFSGFTFANNLRVYATGENLLTFKAPSFVGKDPERPTYDFPRPVRFNLGIDIQF